MSFDRWNVVVLCSLVLLAGCMGGILDTQANAPSLSEVEYPDGASASGIDSAQTITDSTERRSRQTDYVVKYNRTIVSPDGTTQSRLIQKRASLDSQSATFERIYLSDGSLTISERRYVSGSDESFTIYAKNKRHGNSANITKRGPFDFGYQTKGHSLRSDPKPVEWIYHKGPLELDNLTATGTTTVEDEPAIVYELPASASTNEIGIQTMRVVIGINGTLYRFDIKSQIPVGDSGMEVKYLHFSFEPGDVKVQEPEWIERAT